MKSRNRSYPKSSISHCLDNYQRVYCRQMTQPYLFVFGRHPVLSLAELLAYACAQQRAVSSPVMIGAVAITTADLERPETLPSELAGLVKIAASQPPLSRPNNIGDWVKILEPLLMKSLSPKSTLTFGLSFYGAPQHRPSTSDEQRLALILKKNLRASAGHVRWVNGQGRPLSSVQVEKNGLTRPGGCELVVVCQATEVFLGKTLNVQPYQDWSERDYGRPRRNMVQGMLPPKLARLMVNLLGLAPSGTLLDPFCGSGTILAEAMAVGWQDVIGADENKRAIHDSEENLNWLAQRHTAGKLITTSQPLPLPRLLACPIKVLPESLNAGSIQAIVTEPFLGPPLSRPVTELEFRRLSRQLLTLYHSTLESFAKLLAVNGRAVFVLPHWMTATGKRLALPIFDEPLPCSLRRVDPLAAVPSLRGTPLIYSRPNQYVVRELAVLEKIS